MFTGFFPSIAIARQESIVSYAQAYVLDEEKVSSFFYFPFSLFLDPYSLFLFPCSFFLILFFSHLGDRYISFDIGFDTIRLLIATKIQSDRMHISA